MLTISGSIIVWDQFVYRIPHLFVGFYFLPCLASLLFGIDRSGALNQVTLSACLNAMEIASAWQMALIILGLQRGFDGCRLTVMSLSTGSFLRSRAVISKTFKNKKLHRELLQFIALPEGS